MNAFPILHHILHPRALASLALGVLIGPAAAQVVHTYNASSGQLPGPCWQLVDTAATQEPSATTGNLVLGTLTNAENMYYVNTNVSISATLVFEARIKLISGSSTSPARAPAYMRFTTAAWTGNALWIDDGEIFLLAGDNVKGDSAVVDTTAAFHTYTITVVGASVTVEQDGVSLLTGSTFTTTMAFGPVPGLAFGEASLLATGTSEWETVSHNAGVAGCEFGIGCLGTIDVPHNQALNAPALGNTWQAEITNAPSGTLVFIAQSLLQAPFPPIDMAVLGAPGCTCYLRVDAVRVVFADGGGTAAYDLQIPTDLSFLGVRLTTQGAVVDPAANALGIITSNALSGNIGS